ncbi:calcium-binding protein [Yersinia alsatica]|uniref:calcium-binding protein n=1 Tax=Yersinia alsatica TaxID=2890317 RepID=UPI0032EB5E43
MNNKSNEIIISKDVGNDNSGKKISIVTNPDSLLTLKFENIYFRNISTRREGVHLLMDIKNNEGEIIRTPAIKYFFTGIHLKLKTIEAHDNDGEVKVIHIDENGSFTFVSEKTIHNVPVQESKGIIYGTNQDDAKYGTDENDTMVMGAGNDSVAAGEGNDIVYGGPGRDNLGGGKDDDTLYGEQDNDIIFGEEGNDYLDAGSGDDEVLGGSGNDIILGRTGDDLLHGDMDVIHFNEAKWRVAQKVVGNDLIYGGTGNDTTHAGRGNDYISGGRDNDSYRFHSHEGINVIDEYAGEFNKIEFLDHEISELKFSRYGDHLVIESVHQYESLVVIIKNQFNSEGCKVKRLEAKSSGNRWSENTASLVRNNPQISLEQLNKHNVISESSHSFNVDLDYVFSKKMPDKENNDKTALNNLILSKYEAERNNYNKYPIGTKDLPEIDHIIRAMSDLNDYREPTLENLKSLTKGMSAFTQPILTA